MQSKLFFSCFFNLCRLGYHGCYEYDWFIVPYRWLVLHFDKQFGRAAKESVEIFVRTTRHTQDGSRYGYPPQNKQRNHNLVHTIWDECL